MIPEAKLRSAIRGILIREMKYSDSWAGEPIVRNAPQAPSVSHSPITVAMRLLRAAQEANSMMGEDISMSIRASAKNNPAELLALSRIALGMERTSPKALQAEIETLKSEMIDLQGKS